MDLVTIIKNEGYDSDEFTDKLDFRNEGIPFTKTKVYLSISEDEKGKFAGMTRACDAQILEDGEEEPDFLYTCAINKNLACNINM